MTDSLNGLEYVSNVLGLKEVHVAINSVNAEGPDDDGDARFEIVYRVVNNSEVDIEYLVVRLQIFNDSGQVVEETQETYEQTVSAGDEAEFELSPSVNLKLLGKNPERAGILVNVIGCGLCLIEVGSFEIPVKSYELVQFSPAKADGILQLVNGGFWKTDPDDDKDACVLIKTLVQNLTTRHYPEVKLIATIVDKARREISDAGGSQEVRPGELITASGFGYGKDKQLKGARVNVSLRVYYPITSGTQYRKGVQFEESDT